MLKRSYLAAAVIFLNTVLLVCIAFAAGEWWARSVAPRKPETKSITVLNQHGAYHPWAGYRNTPGFEYVLGRWIPTVVNSWGWRGPEPTISRRPFVKRAILLGDSVAFSCWGCRVEASLGGDLRRALELRTGEEWEVIDAAVAGGFSGVSLGTLAHDAIAFQPDVVTTLNGNNDAAVLDERMMLRMGGGRFKHSLYHATQMDIERFFDPRTGVAQTPGVLEQLFKQSALLERLSEAPLIATALAKLANKTPPPSRCWGCPPETDAPAPGPNSPYATSHPERLNAYIQNQLAMSYLAEGVGGKFVAFLQPYLSLKHKVLGEGDRAAIKKVGPELLTWAEQVFPILRSKLQKASSEHPSLNFVDLSLMFTNEQVFADLAHMRYESADWSLGTELLAARMADEIVRVLYAGKTLPNWREKHIAGTPHDWDEQAYLEANPDVSALIAEGKYQNGFEHYRSKGFLEFRPSGFPSWNEKAYLAANPDIVPLIQQGVYASGYEHYVREGKDQGRSGGLPMRWTEEPYLKANPDVAADVAAGKLKSGEEHFMKIGAAENRRGGFSGWDDEGYQIENQDVLYAVLDKRFRSGFDHYLQAGIAEGRRVALGIPALH